jgi:membrane dipeptidase
MFGLTARRVRGQRSVFADHYGPLMRKGGVDVVGLVVGGDDPRLGGDPVDPWWGTLATLDMAWQEAEESSDALAICLNSGDIDTAVAEGKVAAILTVEGGQPVVAGPFADSLVNLRTLHRLGVRSIQLLGQVGNLLIEDQSGEGKNQAGKEGPGLTDLGVSVVQEMNRLGMVIDMAHVSIPFPLFWDVIETSQDPIIDSHSNALEVHDTRRNLSNGMIEAIAQKGGVIGVNFTRAWVGGEADRVTVDDLMRHVDHIVEVGGIDCVGLGPDFIEVDVLGLEPDRYIDGVDEITKLGRVTEALVERGYTDEDVLKILGGNLLSVFSQVLG